MKLTKIYNAIALVLLFLFEGVFFKYLVDCFSSAYSVIIPLALLFILILFYVNKKKKYKDDDIIKHSIILVVKGGSSSITGAIMIVYFLVHIGWLGDILIDYYNDKETFFSFLGIFFFAVMPFIINALFYVENKPKSIVKDSREYLITALSHNHIDNLQCFIENDFDRKKIESKIKFWNWVPILNVLDEYNNIKNIIVIYSKEVNEGLNLHVKQYSCTKNAFEQMVERKYGARNIVVTPFVVSDINDFNFLYHDLKIRVERIFEKLADEKMLFAISSGPATITASLVLLSMKGERGMVYQKQIDKSIQKQPPEKELDEFTVNVFTIQELWNEIIERYN